MSALIAPSHAIIPKPRVQYAPFSMTHNSRLNHPRRVHESYQHMGRICPLTEGYAVNRHPRHVLNSVNYLFPSAHREPHTKKKKKKKTAVCIMAFQSSGG